METWEENAKEAKKHREVFASAYARKPVADLHENIRRLMGLLSEIDIVVGRPGYCPGVQQVLLERADALYASVVQGAFPDRNKNARVPSKEVLQIRYSEARTLLGVKPVLDRMVRELQGGRKMTTNFANFAARRRRLAELWVEASMPLDAKPARVEATIQRCRRTLESLGNFLRPENDEERHERMGEKAHRAIPTAENARVLVGMLFGVAPTTIKKNIGRSEKRRIVSRLRPRRRRRVRP